MTEEQKEILECMFRAWINGGMPLYGGLSIQMVLDYMESLGIDIEPAENNLAELEKKLRELNLPTAD